MRKSACNAAIAVKHSFVLLPVGLCSRRKLLKRASKYQVIEGNTYWADFLTGVGELSGQAEIQHVAASAGTGQSSHGEVGLLPDNTDKHVYAGFTSAIGTAS